MPDTAPAPVSTLPLGKFYADGAKVLTSVTVAQEIVEQTRLREWIAQGHQIVMLVPRGHHILIDSMMELYAPAVEKAGPDAVGIMSFYSEAAGIAQPVPNDLLNQEAAEAVRLLVNGPA